MLRASRFIFLAGVLATMSLTANAAETRRESIGDWGFICSKADAEDAVESCNLFQTALLNNSEKGNEGTAQPQRLLLTRVGYLGETDQPLLLVTAPLGIFLPQGLAVSVEGLEQPVRFGVQHCDAGGCLAFTPMTDEMISAFKKGTEAQVTFFDLQKRAINVPLSLKGFTKGMAELDASRD